MTKLKALQICLLLALMIPSGWYGIWSISRKLAVTRLEAEVQELRKEVRQLQELRKEVRQLGADLEDLQQKGK